MVNRGYDRAEMTEQLRSDLAGEIAKAEADEIALARELDVAFDDAPLPSEWVKQRRAARKHHTNEERLAYYKAHGLSQCDDYPGGQVQFEADVLSGKLHDEDGVLEDPPAEDAYVIRKMLDGTFRFDLAFWKYGYNYAVRGTYEDIIRKLGVAVVNRR